MAEVRSRLPRWLQTLDEDDPAAWALGEPRVAGSEPLMVEEHLEDTAGPRTCVHRPTRYVQVTATALIPVCDWHYRHGGKVKASKRHLATHIPPNPTPRGEQP